MLGVFKTLFSAPAAPIDVRTRVNRVHNLLGPERTDGLVVNLHRGVANVAWPNGETTIERVKHLVPIIA